MKALIFFLFFAISTLVCKGQVVTTIAGSTQGFLDGTGNTAKFNLPTGVAIDNVGNIYVADNENHKIRKITAEGVVTTFAGSTQGFADGQGTMAQFNTPRGIAVDLQGNVYVADGNNHKIRKITPAGSVTTVAGTTQGFANGNVSIAKFFVPYGVATDNTGAIYVADSANHKIRKISPSGEVTTLAGSTQGFSDGSGILAKFNLPTAVAIDASGNVYVADYFNHKIRKITSVGLVSTLAGSTSGFVNGSGIMAKFNLPYGVTTDSNGNVYVGDVFNSCIRKITPSGFTTTLAGTGNYGATDGVGTEAEFFRPSGVVTDMVGNIYVTDTNNNRIRKISQELSIGQIKKNTKIIIYPNPVETVLELQVENNVILNKVRIIDLSGKIILTQTFNCTNINVENLIKGMYILEVFSDNEKQVFKIFKQ